MSILFKLDSLNLKKILFMHNMKIDIIIESEINGLNRNLINILENIRTEQKAISDNNISLMHKIIEERLDLMDVYESFFLRCIDLVIKIALLNGLQPPAIVKNPSIYLLTEWLK